MVEQKGSAERGRNAQDIPWSVTHSLCRFISDVVVETLEKGVLFDFHWRPLCCVGLCC